MKKVQVWGVSMMKDEADVCADTLAQMVNEGIDGLVIYNNGSTDETGELLKKFAEEAEIMVLVLDDAEMGYYQSRKMTTLALIAHELGADWIVPFDADELWYSQEGRRFTDHLRETPDNVVGVQLWNHYCTGKDQRTQVRPFDRMMYRWHEPGQLDKAAYRWRPELVIGQGNHTILRNDIPVPGAGIPIGIRHFPYRSLEHFIRKARNGAAAYAATNLPDSVGTHWRDYGRILETGGEAALAEVFNQWFSFPDPSITDLVLDPAPFLVHPR